MRGAAACGLRGRRRPGLELADLVRAHGDRFRASRALSGEQLAALRAIERCRTPALGGVRESCADCGREHIVWRSCRNRHCPKCQTLGQQRWLDARLAELLPVDYVHVVFTLPHRLNGLALLHPRRVYGALFRAAAASLLEFSRDPRHLGAEPGIIAVLHTWGQNLALHVHLHCIVTAGGLDPTRRRWIVRRRGFLFPVRALSRVFRGKYLAQLGQSLAADADPAARAALHALGPQEWVVYAKRPFGGPRHVLDYLARYTRRIALTNDRLLGLHDGLVELRWRDYAHGGKKKVLRLAPDELLARFVRHVLPHGFRRVRHYGLLANRHKLVKLTASRRYFGTPPPPPRLSTAALLARMGLDLARCPDCGSPRIRREPVPARRVPARRPVPRARAPTAELPP